MYTGGQIDMVIVQEIRSSWYVFLFEFVEKGMKFIVGFKYI